MSDFDCRTCGKRCLPGEYHPFLFCELVKLGHRDPAAYLAAYGYARLDDKKVER